MTEFKTFFITGGGTGGHIYPALAIAKALIEAGHRVFFVGNKKNLEYKICKDNNINFLPVDVDFMPRKLSLKFLLWGLKTLIAGCNATLYALKYKPNAIFATGGYVSAPALIAGRFLKIPFITHDCDSYPGIVTRVFSKYAKATTLQFEDAKKYLKTDKTFVFGNPIRENFFNTNREECLKKLGLENKKTVLIMGGSQGANTLNSAVCDIINNLDRDDIQIILQTGKKHFEATKSKLKLNPKNVLVAPYFEDTSIPLGACDLVVSRGGSLSISEILATNTPSIIVPYPYAAKNHQMLNAKSVESLGATIILEDKNCNYETLKNLIYELLDNEEKLATMKRATVENSKPNGAKDIVEKLLEIAKC